ncbi:complement C5 [Osmerus mordax]|uniref:complement C5 n=1 Tax=Osmerus mordax TaxID=8014 RepID=UPI00350EF37A
MRTLLLSFLLLGLAETQDSKSYLITAPKIWRLEASERVMVQVMDYTEDVQVYLELKSSLARDAKVYDKAFVTLTTSSSHQQTISLQVRGLVKDATHVILFAQTNEFSNSVEIPVSRRSGFLFIQTDKPLYTPQQSVKVRAFSLNEDLTTAKRNVFVTFRDPDEEIVETVELQNSQGIPSLQDPFKIPLKPKFGLWSVEASYGAPLVTSVRAQFEIKEYVLPSIAIQILPESNYLSYGNAEQFKIKVVGRYVHGAPVSGAIVYLRFGYVSGKKTPVVLSGSIVRTELQDDGTMETTVNVKRALAHHESPLTLEQMFGKENLYVAVSVMERTGGLSQEAELTTVKFVKSPYTMKLLATPLFIKPLLPYKIRMLVLDPLGEPVARVPVKLLEAMATTVSMDTERLDCAQQKTKTGSDGVAYFICNWPANTLTARINFKTDDSYLPPQSQAEFVLEATVYNSPKKRYLYISVPPNLNTLEVGTQANIDVVFSVAAFLNIKSVSYLVISNGRVEASDTQPHLGGSVQSVRFQVTPRMVPSIRVLVYYVLHGEGATELVADSVWLGVKANCMNGLQAELSYVATQQARPGSSVSLQVRTGTEALVALSATDTALQALRSSRVDPMAKVLRHIEKSDPGCGGGGGKDIADIFRLAGLTFMTNANAKAIPSQEDVCQELVRPKRSLTYEMKKEKSKLYLEYVAFCWAGLKHHPVYVQCSDRLKVLPKEGHMVYKLLSVQRARQVFVECCEFSKHQPDTELWNARADFETVFDNTPKYVRSFFPESWLFEVHVARAGVLTLPVKLPDSLTTWEISAVAMFANGLCVAEPKQISVTQPVSVDVPLPYSMVRGEQLQLSGSVYNQQTHDLQFCVTLTAGPGVCLYHGHSVDKDGLWTTKCTMSTLQQDSVRPVTFTLLAFESGRHELTFTLQTSQGVLDTVQKTLYVKPEGVLTEKLEVKNLDPRALYGSSISSVQMKYWVPEQVVPYTSVDRQLIISGEVLGEILAIVGEPKGLEKLLNVPMGSGQMDVLRVTPYYYVFHFLEKLGRWGTLDPHEPISPGNIKKKMKEGIVSVKSFINRDGSYSMWKQKGPSTLVTSQVMKTMGQVASYLDFGSADYDSMFRTLSWLVDTAQVADGSFVEDSPDTKFTDVKQGSPEFRILITSFVMIGIKTVTELDNNKLHLKDFSDSLKRAADYVSQNAQGVKSIYVRAVAAYALLLQDLRNPIANILYKDLEKSSREKGNPVNVRYWQENVKVGEQLPPHTVEITSYVLLSSLLKNKMSYALPVVRWLTEEQYYGGFQSAQDMMMALGALTQYTLQADSSRLAMKVDVSYSQGRDLPQVTLTQKIPVARPIQLTEEKDVKVSIGGGTGFSKVKLRTLYYKLADKSDNCNFDFSINVIGPDPDSHDFMRKSPRIVACAKYKPESEESLQTVMEIQMPTGVQPSTEDLDYLQNSLEAVMDDYEINGDLLTIQLTSVPSTDFACVGFRFQQSFKMGMASDCFFRVYELRARKAVCSRMFSPLVETKLQRLCAGEQCRCLSVECSSFRNNVSRAVTVEQRLKETCQPAVKYALKVQIKSTATEGEFIIYVATVLEPMIREEKENVAKDLEVEFIKKTTCDGVDMKPGEVYLTLVSDKLKIPVDERYKYRFILDSKTTVEKWPIGCTESPCSDFVKVLDDYEFSLTFDGCP